MSRLKLSFSFLLAILLVGILSTAAFATGSNPVVPKVNGGNGDPADVQTGVVTNDTAHDNSYNTVDKSNANKTGTGIGTNDGSTFNQVIKSDDMVKDNQGNHGTQRTHGSYMNNTNSCASCHQTHTGASKNLLFKDGEYATCTACHDGTLGFYNVFTGSNSAGTFGGTHDGNMSVHLANGTVELKAAPGGNNNGTDNWTAEFTCASCHAPHGSFSDRLLHTNPNDMGNTLVKNGGKRLEGVPVITAFPAKVQQKDADGNLVVDKDGNPVMIDAKLDTADVKYTDAAGTEQTINYIIYSFKIGDAGAPTNSDYAAKGLATSDAVLQLMKWNGTSYVIDTDPWLHGYEFDADHNKHYWTAFQDSTYNKEPIDTDQLKKGEVLGAGFAGFKSPTTNSITITLADKSKVTKTISSWLGLLQTGNIARGYVVKLDKTAPDANNVMTTTVSSLWASKKADGSTNPGYVANRGVAMSGFCAACHTDYLAGSGKESGTFDHAYRHTTTSDNYTCVRCHYAHGTDVTIMRDARGLTYDQILDNTAGTPGANYFPGVTGDARTALVKDYLIDKNPSSALKRYTNMAVCWGCHTSSHSEGTRNTDTYQYNQTPGIDSDRNGIEFDY